ncbi:MAG: hypothetical protein K2W96_22460 [Gemmataceae bacterium]|nr:hypothetical protein [Gemmataceae bacterium]
MDDTQGEEISLSSGKSATQFLIGVLVGLVGGPMGLWFAITVITTDNKGDMPRWLTVLLGWLCALFSLVLVAGGLFAIGAMARQVWRGDRLVLGETALSCLGRGGQVLTRIPYDNIAEVRFVLDEELHNGPRDDRVAILLIDRRREDTVLREESPLAGDDEGDTVIQDRYRITPRKLYQKLVKRWKRSV